MVRRRLALRLPPVGFARSVNITPNWHAWPAAAPFTPGWRSSQAAFNQPQDTLAAGTFERAHIVMPGDWLDSDRNSFDATCIAVRCPTDILVALFHSER
jgi:hypothetical protein